MLSLNDKLVGEIFRMHGELRFDSNPDVDLSMKLSAISDRKLLPATRTFLVSAVRKEASGHLELMDRLTAVSFESYYGSLKSDHLLLRAESILGLDSQGHSISFTALVEHVKSDQGQIFSSALSSLVRRKEVEHAIELLNSERLAIKDGLQMPVKMRAKFGAHAHEIEHAMEHNHDTAMEHNHKLSRMKTLNSRIHMLQYKIATPMRKARSALV